MRVHRRSTPSLLLARRGKQPKGGSTPPGAHLVTNSPAHSTTDGGSSTPGLQEFTRTGVGQISGMYHSGATAETRRIIGGVVRHESIGLPGGLEPEQLVETAARHGARNVRVFGSVARGTAAEGSDLDLLVDFEPGRNLFDLVGLKQEVEAALGGSRKVDVVTENALSPRVRERVLREAVSL